jgi:hypothetical protein
MMFVGAPLAFRYSLFASQEASDRLAARVALGLSIVEFTLVSLLVLLLLPVFLGLTGGGATGGE